MELPPFAVEGWGMSSRTHSLFSCPLLGLASIRGPGLLNSGNDPNPKGSKVYFCKHSDVRTDGDETTAPPAVHFVVACSSLGLEVS